MKQGWIKSYRSDIESDVWAMPPLYYRVWHYILLSVNYEEKDIPMKDGSHLKILRGQYLTSIRTICKDIGWYEGGIFKEPNPKTVKEILDWMEKVGLITVEHGKFNRQYSLITIVNYEDIQRNDLGIEMADKSDGNTKATTDKQEEDITKNNKNYKKEKEVKENKENINSSFEDFWREYPRKVKKKRTLRIFEKRIREGVSSKDLIIAAANYTKYCEDKGTDIKFIKHPATFIGVDRPYEEFIEGIPKDLTSLPKNVSDALKLYKESKSKGDVVLW